MASTQILRDNVVRLEKELAAAKKEFELAELELWRDEDYAIGAVIIMTKWFNSLPYTYFFKKVNHNSWTISTSDGFEHRPFRVVRNKITAPAENTIVQLVTAMRTLPT